MSNYSFLNLSPVDFEELTRDLLQKHLNVFFESFKEGKDKGIDLRYSRNNKNNIIVQCKRYNDLKTLYNNLKSEVSKVKKLKPKRYVISTSIGLTPNNKDDIQKIFKGIPLSSEDIIGKKDLNNLLGKYPKIEQQHYKLWLNSTEVVKRILHNGTYNRSEFEEKQIKRELRIYVSNESYKDAIKILNDSNFVIISGIPGIGKTTLARMLVYNLLLKGYELVSVSSDIMEADNVYDKDKKQVFYYDDFLGTNFLLELIVKNEDKRIIKFIERIGDTRRKKLILTTREYILNQAIERFEVLRDKSLQLSKCVIDLKKYTNLIRGKILYNHIFFSELPLLYINNLILNNRFLRIIRHPNFNPRIIQYLTEINFIGNTTPEDYYNFFIENLNNPHTIWDYAFKTHISPISRYLLLILISMGVPAFKEDVYDALCDFFEKNSKYYGIHLNIDTFNNCLKECENTFISIELSNKKHVIKYQNPSIKDFLYYYIKHNDEIILHIIKSAVYFNQLLEIFSTNSFDNKVILSDQLKMEIFYRLKKNIYKMPTSVLYYALKSDKSGFTWYYKHRYVGRIDRLNQVTELFYQNKNKKLTNFILNLFNRINNKNLAKEGDSIDNYISIIEKITFFNELKIEDYLNNIFSENISLTFDNLKEIEKLEDYYPEEYVSFKESEENKITNIISKIADDEYNNLMNDKNEIEVYIEELEKTENKYNCDLTDFKEKAINKLNEVEKEKEEERTGILSNIKETVSTHQDDEQMLIEMFNSLKYL